MRRGDTACHTDIEFVYVVLRPVCGAVDPYLGRDEADGVGLGDDVLEVPAFLCFGGKGNEIYASKGEDAEVFVLRVVL